MKRVIILFCLLCAYGSTIAQKWEILNTELKAERKAEVLKISFLDDRRSLEVNADTAYLDNEGEYLLIRKGSLVGIVDPWDLFLLAEPTFRSVKSVMGYFQLENSEGYYFVDREEPETPVSHTYADIQCVVPDGVDLSSGNPILVLNAGKFGLLKPWDLLNPYVKLEYDEIVFYGLVNDDYYFMMRKGANWGAGGCEGIEIEPRYDRLDFLSGECTSHLFIAWKGENCGIVQSGVKKPLVELDYSEIRSLSGADGTSWFFLYRKNELVSFINTELSDNYVNICHVQHIIYVREIDKTFIVYDNHGEILKLVLPETFFDKLTSSGYMSNLIYLDM